MPKGTSTKVQAIREKLRHRIQGGFMRPGDRFPSNREIAERYGISYQTAHRLIQELVETGLLVRKVGSGTYLQGNPVNWNGCQILFNPRAKRTGSFGHTLLQYILGHLKQENLSAKASYVHRPVSPETRRIPMLWEAPEILTTILDERRYAILLQDEPPPGVAGTFIDSVNIDDFSGGVAAGEVLTHTGSGKPAILAGPADDARSRERVRGFRHVHPRSKIVYAENWYYEGGFAAAEAVLKIKPGRIFCCNDRLAQALIDYCSKHFCGSIAIVGFDDAPIAEELNLSTIAIPWQQTAFLAAELLKRRLNGETSTATRHILAPRPVERNTIREFPTTKP